MTYFGPIIYNILASPEGVGGKNFKHLENQKMKNSLIIFALASSVTLLQGCDSFSSSSCSQEDIQKKVQLISEKMQSANPEDVMKLTQEWQKISGGAQNMSAGDICEAYDSFLDKLNNK